MCDHISYSEINAWLRCQYQWYWSYREGVEPIEHSMPLDVGILFHEIVKGEDWNGAQEKLNHRGAIKGSELSDPDKLKRWDSVCLKVNDIIDSYTLFRGANPLTIVATEVERTYPIFSESARSQVPLLSIADAVVDIEGEKWLLEYKTGQPNIEFLALYDLQSTIECLVHEAVGTIYELIDSSTRMISIRRLQIERTPLELSWALDTVEEVLNQMETVEPVMNRERECNWCSYNKLCLALITGGEVETLIETYYQPKRRRDGDEELLSTV